MPGSSPSARTRFWVFAFLVTLAGCCLVGIVYFDTVPRPAFMSFPVGIACAFVVVAVSTLWMGREERAILDANLARGAPFMGAFSNRYVSFSARNGVTRVDWPGVDAIVALPSGTGIRAGPTLFLVSDDDLPEGLDPAAFRARLHDWKDAA